MPRLFLRKAAIATEDPASAGIAEMEEVDVPEVEYTEFRGLKIAIENNTGTFRQGDGWKVFQETPYGFIPGITGADGEELDCFLGPNQNAEEVYVLHILDPVTEEYDEDKVFLGFDSIDDVISVFSQHYNDPEEFLDEVSVLTWADFLLAINQEQDEPDLKEAAVFTGGVLKKAILRKAGERQPAQIGEVREWGGKKMRKESSGWVPVRTAGQAGPSQATPEAPKPTAPASQGGETKPSQPEQIQSGSAQPEGQKPEGQQETTPPPPGKKQETKEDRSPEQMKERIKEGFKSALRGIFDVMSKGFQGQAGEGEAAGAMEETGGEMKREHALSREEKPKEEKLTEPDLISMSDERLGKHIEEMKGLANDYTQSARNLAESGDHEKARQYSDAVKDLRRKQKEAESELSSREKPSQQAETEQPKQPKAQKPTREEKKPESELPSTSSGHISKEGERAPEGRKMNANEIGRKIGAAIAKDTIANGYDVRWAGLDPQDADQLLSAGIEPDSEEWNDAEAEARKVYESIINKK